MKKVAIVTGASMGIGRLTAIKLAENGFYVFAVARNIALLNEIKSNCIEPLVLDVGIDSDVKEAVNKVIQQKGRIDLLVNGASFSNPGAVEIVPMEQIRKQFEVNVFGYARFIQAVLPSMRKNKSGRIVNISSSIGRMSLPGNGWYAATKYAVEGFTDALRLEVKQFGIDVVLVEPGAIKTPFMETMSDLLASTPHPEDYQSVVNAVHQIAQNDQITMNPEDVANSICKVCLAKRPVIRLVTPASLHVVFFIKRLISDRLWDWLIRKSFKL